MNPEQGAGAARSVLDHLVEFVLDEDLLIFDVLANQRGIGDDAALDQLLKTDQLAELALEVELVALLGYQVDVALALVDYGKKIIDVYIAK